MILAGGATAFKTDKLCMCFLSKFVQVFIKFPKNSKRNLLRGTTHSDLARKLSRMSVIRNEDCRLRKNPEGLLLLTSDS
jgi:hypothetical protein